MPKQTTIRKRTIKKGVVIVTGSSGLIGAAVVRQLAKKYRVIGIDNPGYPYPPPEADCIPMDMADEQHIADVFALIRKRYGKRIVSVVHLAAYYSFSQQSSPLYEQITVRGTAAILKALRDFTVEQFIFSSTMLVYRPTTPGVAISESSPLAAPWEYPASKIKTERLIARNKTTMPTVSLRIAGVYDEMGHSIPLSHHIQRIYENQLTSHFFPGDMTHGSPYVHRSDLVLAILAAITKRKKLPRHTVINIGEPETLSFATLQQTIAQLLSKRHWITLRVPKLLAVMGSWVQNLFGRAFIKPWMISLADDHMELDITRAQQLLGWTPEHSLRTTLPTIIRNLKKNPKKWYTENKL